MVEKDFGKNLAETFWEMEPDFKFPPKFEVH